MPERGSAPKQSETKYQENLSIEFIMSNVQEMAVSVISHQIIHPWVFVHECFIYEVCFSLANLQLQLNSSQGVKRPVLSLL